MPELRQNFFTKEWVIIATERAKRPEELATHRPAQTVPSFVETCPFCPGNESKTPRSHALSRKGRRALGSACHSQ
jgi:UDPglucose--hexose-1-phosphate uridylyltransferase